jgi:uncharacterized protein (TIGR00369 family)
MSATPHGASGGTPGSTLGKAGPEADGAPQAQASQPLLDRLREELDNPPFHALLRPRPVHVDADGGVCIALAWRPEFSGRRGAAFFHGGVLASLIDMAAHAAVALRSGGLSPTLDLRIDYLRPALAGELLATARVLKLGRSVSRADVQVHGADGQLLAVGRGAFSSASPSP